MDTPIETDSFASELGKETAKAVVATAAVTAVSLTIYLGVNFVLGKIEQRRARKAVAEDTPDN